MSTNLGITSVDLFNKDTFLTSLRDTGQSSNDISPISPYSPKGMIHVREKYAQLHQVVGSLNEKITSVLVRQEKDFLAAYRAHMYNVQKELHETKEKIMKNETFENKTEKIKILEEERDWYRKEALRLDTFTTNIKKDFKQMKEKLETIEEDRDWLEKQLKASKKINKLLRAELEIRLTNISTIQTNEIKQPISPVHDESEQIHNLPLVVVEKEEYYKKEIKQLKKELQKYKKDLNRIREINNNSHQNNQMEIFFLQSIESVKKDIGRRRNQSRENKTRPIPQLKVDPIPDFEPNLKDFTSADRIRVIERLLANDQVLSIIYDHLFPSNEQDSTLEIKREKQNPVGSGVAAVNASRDAGSSTLFPLDTSTLEYLKLK